MRKLIFKLNILSNVVLSKNAATEGEHQSLDYIPGSVFLGIVASALYGKDATHAREVFHGQKVQFTDAKPLIKNKESYKMPLSLFRYKGDDENQSPWHLHKTTLDKTKQPVQMREGYINEEGVSRLSFDFNLRTAIDNGKAAEGQLYGYQSIPAGSTWSFALVLNEHNPYSAIDFKNALEGRKNIGRSRSAEYGLVEINFLREEELKAEELLAGQVAVYAESDLCFFNDFGYPNLQPTPEDLGLPAESIIDWKKSQLRYRTLSKYNYKRQTYDASIYVIEKGSVFIAEVPIKYSNKAECEGVGYYRHAGLGRIQYNPKWFDQLNFISHKVEKNSNKLSYLEGIEVNTAYSLDILLNQKNKIQAQAIELAKLWEDLELRDKAIAIESASQWSKLEGQLINLKKSKDLRNFRDFDSFLFDETDGFFRHGVDSKIWRKNEFDEFLQKKLKERESESVEKLIFFANKMRHHVK